MDTPYLPPNLPTHRRMLRPTPRKLRYPDLEIDQILAWADAHYARTGEWPTADSGFIAQQRGGGASPQASAIRDRVIGGPGVIRSGADDGEVAGADRRTRVRVTDRLQLRGVPVDRDSIGRAGVGLRSHDRYLYLR